MLQTQASLTEPSAEALALARQALEEIRAGCEVAQALRRHPLPGGGHIGKSTLVRAYRDQTARGEWPADSSLEHRLRMKPVRTLSGVTTVTVLTKPYPCPGKCVFCPTDVRMPKSYLADEPGARRALRHNFDPYAQTSARLQALDAIGHPTSKVELLILGGTWSAYRKDYQEWFLRRCLEALNGFPAPDLETALDANERSAHRNVGLVIETRPDWVTVSEVQRLRRLGVTKVQLGAQSLDDRVLRLNRRGHTVDQTRTAVSRLRAAGFKIVLHWMPNLLGADLESDRQDFVRLWGDESLRPDELKIYPCQLLSNAELSEYWARGEYAPYTSQELVGLLADVKTSIPRYCRVNRVIRDIPSTNVLAGNRRTSLRQDVQGEMRRRGASCACIRCREVRGQVIGPGSLRMNNEIYPAGGATEHFLTFVDEGDRLAGFLRLSLPGPGSPATGIVELDGAALVREVHVYGPSVPVGESEGGAAQHAGLGASLMDRAEAIARRQRYRRLAVIAAVGTRGYYRRLGYARQGTYMVKEL